MVLEAGDLGGFVDEVEDGEREFADLFGEDFEEFTQE